MNFDFDAIEKAAQALKSAPARTSKFAPKAKPRAAPVSKGSKVEKEIQKEPLNVPVETLQKEAAKELQKDSRKEPQEEPQEELGGIPHREPEVEATQPQDAAPEPPASPVSSPPRPQEQVLASVSPIREMSVPVSSPEKASTKAIVKVPSPSQDLVHQEDSDEEETATDEPKKRKRRATGRMVVKVEPEKKRRQTAEELANMELEPGRDSILKYVQRARAQERLREAEKRRKRAEGLDEETEEERLALEPPPTQPSSGGGGIELELVDGKLVPKEQSLIIHAQAEPVHRRVVEYKNIVNNASYSKRMNNDKWSAEETEMFFQAVQTFGTDFELIARLFPGRQRRGLANKWRRESKLNPERIDAVYNRTGDVSKMQKLIEALGQATEADVEGGNLGLEAADLFPDASKAIVPVEASEDREEDPEEPPETKPPKRGRPRKQTPKPKLAPKQPSRRVTSRRKAQPAQSVPVEHLKDGPQAASEKSTKRGRKAKRKAVTPPSDDAADVDVEEIST